MEEGGSVSTVTVEGEEEEGEGEEGWSVSTATVEEGSSTTTPNDQSNLLPLQ